MNQLLIKGYENRINQIKIDVINQILDKYSRTYGFIQLKENLIINDKKVTDISYQSNSSDLDLYFDKKDFDYVSIKEIENLDDLIEIAKVLL